jgi:hypothetical protein
MYLNHARPIRPNEPPAGNHATNGYAAHPAATETELRMHVLELSVELLIARSKVGDYSAAGYTDAARLLESVPLTTSTFENARRRMANAAAYSEQGEFGAAAFELRAVRGALAAL